MSDVRPELQQIHEALGMMCEQPYHADELAEHQALRDCAVAALARVEATLNAQQHHCVYPECVDGEKPELCGHCGDAERAEAAEARVAELEAELLEKRALLASDDPAAALARERLSAFADLTAAKARVVAAEAERDEALEVVAAHKAAAAEDLSLATNLEAERDALVAALERIATGNFLEAWDAQQIARAYLAAVSATGASGAPQDTASPAPAEPPREEVE